MSVTSSGSGTTTIGGDGVSVAAPVQYLLLFGDSKTDRSVSYTTWPDPLAAQAGPGWLVVDVGVSGATLATTLPVLTATLNKMPAPAAADGAIDVLINLGSNDFVVGPPTEATWEAGYWTLLDAIHTKWPTARVWLMRPWRRTYNTLADTFAGYLGVIQAARSDFVALGPDERGWMKGADDGAAMTVDGIHYTPAGNDEIVNQWKAVLWP